MSYYCSNYLAAAGYPCTVAGSYSYYLEQLKSTDSLAHIDGILCETYVGWPDATQAAGILPFADRIFVHAYVTDPSLAYPYTFARLGYFGSTTSLAKLVVLYSSEDTFLGPWLATNPEQNAYPVYLSAYAADPRAWKTKIELLGQQWFDYSNMPYFVNTKLGLADPAPSNGNYISLLNNNTIAINTAGCDGNLQIAILDMQGRLVQYNTVFIPAGTAHYRQSLDAITPGIYICVVNTPDGKPLFRQKFVIR